MKHDTEETIVNILTQAIYIISMLCSAWFLWHMFAELAALRAMQLVRLVATLEQLGIATLDSQTINTLEWLDREHAIGQTLMLLRLSLNQGPLVLRIVLNKRVKRKSVSSEK